MRLLCLTASQCILLSIETPMVYYLISSSLINYAITPCIIPQARLLLFAGFGRGELILIRLDELHPSTEHTRVLCKEHGRVRLDCGVISSLYIANSCDIILSDDSYATIRFSLRNFLYDCLFETR